MSEKILCPFCKKPIYAVSCGIEDEAWVVLHDGDNCPFEMDGKNGYIWSSKEELVKALNTRPIEDALREENKKLKEALDSFDEYHPRAVKLLRKRKNFLVVAEDEPYFGVVYTIIRDNEKAKNTWTNEDEFKYQKCFVEALK